MSTETEFSKILNQIMIDPLVREARFTDYRPNPYILNFNYNPRKSASKNMRDFGPTFIRTPMLEKVKVFVIAIAEDLWIKTGLQFEYIYYNRKDEMYIFEFNFRNPKVKTHKVFKIGYEISELKESSSLIELLQEFYIFLDQAMSIAVDKLLEDGDPLGPIISDEIARHAERTEKNAPQ